MNQPTREELISAYVDGELDPTEVQAVLAVLASDPSMRDLELQLREISRKIRALPAARIPRGLESVIATAIAEPASTVATSKEAGPGKRSFALWGGLALAMAASAIGIALWAPHFVGMDAEVAQSPVSPPDNAVGATDSAEEDESSQDKAAGGESSLPNDEFDSEKRPDSGMKSAKAAEGTTRPGNQENDLMQGKSGDLFEAAPLAVPSRSRGKNAESGVDLAMDPGGGPAKGGFGQTLPGNRELRINSMENQNLESGIAGIVAAEKATAPPIAVFSLEVPPDKLPKLLELLDGNKNGAGGRFLPQEIGQGGEFAVAFYGGDEEWELLYGEMTDRIGEGLPTVVGPEEIATRVIVGPESDELARFRAMEIVPRTSESMFGHPATAEGSVANQVMTFDEKEIIAGGEGKLDARRLAGGGGLGGGDKADVVGAEMKAGNTNSPPDTQPPGRMDPAKGFGSGGGIISPKSEQSVDPDLNTQIPPDRLARGGMLKFIGIVEKKLDQSGQETNPPVLNEALVQSQAGRDAGSPDKLSLYSLLTSWQGRPEGALEFGSSPGFDSIPGELGVQQRMESSGKDRSAESDGRGVAGRLSRVLLIRIPSK